MENLLGAKTKDIHDKFTGGAFMISRLSPQDYHRWHYPVSGTIKRITPYDGYV